MLQEYNPKNENIFIHVNGELLPRKEAKVSVFDSIVQNGDGVWEEGEFHLYIQDGYITFVGFDNEYILSLIHI